MTPQEKKSLSYAKDRKNRYGNNDKAARTTIPLIKARRNRSQRHAENILLTSASKSTSSDDLVSIENQVLEPRTSYWIKRPDMPLGEILKHKLISKTANASQLAARFSGTHNGPTDLSTNPIHMEGFGQDNVYTDYLRSLSPEG